MFSRSSAGSQYAPRNRASFDVSGIRAGRASTRERVPGSGGGARAKQRVERVARCEEIALFVKAWARAGRLRRSRAARRTGSSGYDLRSPLDPRGRFPSRGGGRAPAPSPPDEKTRSPSTRGSRGGASGTRGGASLALASPPGACHPRTTSARPSGGARPPESALERVARETLLHCGARRAREFDDVQGVRARPARGGTGRDLPRPAPQGPCDI